MQNNHFVISQVGGSAAVAAHEDSINSHKDIRNTLTNISKKVDSLKIPTKTSQLTNDSKFLTSIPSEYVTESELTAKNYALKSEIPSVPVQSVNNKTGAVSLTASDVSAVPTTRKVNGKALSSDITLSASDVGADSSGAASSAIAAHNSNSSAHTDIRNQLSQLSSEKAEINEKIIELESDVVGLHAQTLQQTPLFANSIEECTNTTKMYVLPDNFIYAYMMTKTEVVVGGYTNKLKDKLLLNHRISISGAPTLKAHDGTVSSATSATELYYIPVKGGDKIRVNRSINPHFDNGYARIAYCDASKTKLAPASDTTASSAVKLTEADGVTSWTVGYDGTGAKMSCYDSIAYMVVGINIHMGTAVTASEVSDLILTVNEEIKEGKIEVIETYAWANTGHAFVPAEYEERIVELENEVESINNRIEKESTNQLAVSEVFAPSPQLPADGSETADFNGSNISCNDIYNYLDELISRYPLYISKETMGKDESGQYDWNRYVLCRRYYDAWQKVNYPAMYAWVNGSTVIYSASVSPRIGDTIYTTAYIGTAKGTVTAVSNANQTRTVGGVVYTRDKSKDVEPTLVWTYSSYAIRKRTTKPTTHKDVLDNGMAKIATIATHSDTTMTDSAGNTYVRYPLGDRNNEFVRPPVIIVGANEHGVNGDPPEPAIVTARMTKDLCECKQADNPFLNLLKNEYMVIMCPVINPYGFTHGPYTNANDVNIDRNFDTPGWHNDTAAIGGSGDYGGSENETQYFMNTVFESKPVVAVANHGLGSGIDTATGEAANAGFTAWMFGRNRAEYTEPLESIAEIMAANYNLIFQQLQATSEAPPATHAKTRSYIEFCGVTGGAVEMQAREGFVLEGEGKLHTARILEADYTLLLQFLYMLIDKAE